jgi:hypothetical protein
MAVTTASLIEAYPEFEPLSEQYPDLVDAVIARAERRISISWPDEIRDDIVELQVAHLLAMSPAGRNAKLSEPGKPSSYEYELKLRKKAFAYGRLRVV